MRKFLGSGLAPLLAAICGVVFTIAATLDPVDAGDGRPVLRGDGVVRTQSAYPIDETVKRLKDDIAAKGIMFFQDIDQGQLARDAGVTIHRSRLLVFGNPPLGTLFIQSDPDAGLDWPVRLLVYEDAEGRVWTAHTDFDWIARRHRIRNRKDAFAMASKVIASITGSVAAK